MALYNYKETVYPDGQKEIVVYEKPIRLDGFREEKKRECPRYEENEDGVEFDPITGVLRSKEESERCVASSLSRTINKIYELAHSNKWEYFVTWTFDPKEVNRYDYQDCYVKIKNYLDNLRKSSPDVKYLIVPELHKDGAFHFHGLMSDCKLKLLPSNQDGIYNIKNFKAGFTTVSLIKNTSAASTYITKYITKDLMAVSKNNHRYLSSQNLELPYYREKVCYKLGQIFKRTWSGLREKGLLCSL